MVIKSIAGITPSDLGANFQYIKNNNKNTLDVKATKKKDNYYYVCKVLDARKKLKKKERAKSVKSDVVRLNLTDVASPGDNNLSTLKPEVTIRLSKNSITKDYNEKAKLQWTVTGDRIRDVRVEEVRAYKKKVDRKTIYKKKNKKKPAKSGSTFVAPPVKTTYKIIATNAFGTASAEVTLDVNYIKKNCQFDIRHAFSKPEIDDSGNDSARMFWKIEENGKPHTQLSITGGGNPPLKGNFVVSPTSTRTYNITISNDIIVQTSNLTLNVVGVSTTSINLNPPATTGAPTACLSLDKDYIIRDGNDSAQLAFAVGGFGSDITSIEVRDITAGKVIASPTARAGQVSYTAEVTVQPTKDTTYRVTVETAVGSATAQLVLDTKKKRTLGAPTLPPEEPEDNPGTGPGGPGIGTTPGGGGGGTQCPPGWTFNTKQNKCVKISLKDPWLPPPLFPPGIIKAPVFNPGVGYDPSLNGNDGGSGRIWKGRCEVGIQRVNADWEAVGIGSEYTLYIGDTVYQPERLPVTLGVPNGQEIHNKNDIKWEDLTEAEIKRLIPGAEVFGTPYRIKDMSGFDSRGSEIFKDVSLLDIQPIDIRGKKVEKGIYFDMTEFDDFQSPNVTFIASNRSADKNYHAVEIPDIGLFNEDSGRTIKKDVTGGKIYGPLVNESRVPKEVTVDVQIPIDVNAEGWNGKGIYYELLDEEGTIDVDFTVVDSNYETTNSITIPTVGTFKDNSKRDVIPKKVGAPKIYGPVTSGGFGELYLGSEGVGGSELDDSSLVLGFDDIGSAFFVRAVAEFTNDPEPQLTVTESGLLSFRFETDDNSSQSGIAIERILIRDPDTNAVIVEFNYQQEENVEYSEWKFFDKIATYPIEYVRPGKEGDEIRVRKQRLQLQFDDNPQNGWDTNAYLEILPEPQLQVIKQHASVSDSLLMIMQVSLVLLLKKFLSEILKLIRLSLNLIILKRTLKKKLRELHYIKLPYILLNMSEMVLVMKLE